MNDNFKNGTKAGDSLVFLSENNEPVTVKEFYGFRGDIMGSTAACLGMLAMLTLIFATCGAASLHYVQHKSR